jgi:hypothetical protein
MSRCTHKEVGCKVAIRKHYGAKPDGAFELFGRDGEGGPSGHASAKSQRYENVEPHSRYTHVKVEPQSNLSRTSVEPQSNRRYKLPTLSQHTYRHSVPLHRLSRQLT